MSDVEAGKQTFHKPDRARVADKIFDDLKAQILNGALPGGSKLPTERDLAEHYGVSGATIRESVQALNAMGLVSIRHGAGSYVTAQGDTMIAVSIASVVQLEKMGAADVFGVQAILNSYAAELAVQRATKKELAALRAAAERLGKIVSVEQAAVDLKDFLRQLSAISRNALLAALCKFLIDIQIDMALEISERDLSDWQAVAGALHLDRLAIVEALEARNADKAVALVRAYHKRALALSAATRRAKEMESSDPNLSRLISSIMSGRVLLAGP